MTGFDGRLGETTTGTLGPGLQAGLKVQASCWSMKAVSWALLMAPTLVAAS